MVDPLLNEQGYDAPGWKVFHQTLHGLLKQQDKWKIVLEEAYKNDYTRQLIATLHHLFETPESEAVRPYVMLVYEVLLLLAEYFIIS